MTNPADTVDYPTAHFYCDFMAGQRPGWQVDAPLHSGVIDHHRALIYLEGYAAHQIALANISYDQIGQLVRKPDGVVHVTEMFNYRNTQLDQMLGPFSSYKEYLLGTWLQDLSRTVKKMANPLHWYLVYLDKKRLVEASKVLIGERGPFFLKHPDDKLDQYFVKEGRMSALLDWQG